MFLFSKIYKNILYTFVDKSTFRIPFGGIGTTSLQVQCNCMQILHKEKAEYH